MAIQDNSELDRVVNNKNTFKGVRGNTKICRKCGTPLVYSRQDKQGDADPSYKWRWHNRICIDCYHKLNLSPFRGDIEGQL